MLNALIDSMRPKNVLNVDTSTWGAWPGDGSSSGQTVDRDTSLQLMSVYGSVRLITDGISTLPVDVFDAAAADGERVQVRSPEWLSNPTPDLEYESWCSQVLMSLLLDGNAYLGVGRDRVGRVVTVVPLDPARVQVSRDIGSGRKIFWVNGFKTEHEIVHVRGMMLPGSDVGLSPIEYARRTIGLGLNAVDFGSEFFGGEGNMPGVIELPHPAQPDTMSNLAKQWRRKRTQGGKGLPGVLQNGASWKPTGVNHEQAQFLATRNFTAAEVAGQLFLVDPSDLGIAVDGTSLTYTNLQQRNARRLGVTFLPWIIRIERALSKLTDQPQQFVKLNVDGLLRADQTSRYASYQLGLKNDFLTIDEVRRLEDLPTRTVTGPAPSSARDLAELVQKIYLGVGAIVTAEEARTILNSAGANLDPGTDPTRRTNQ